VCPPAITPYGPNLGEREGVACHRTSKKEISVAPRIENCSASQRDNHKTNHGRLALWLAPALALAVTASQAEAQSVEQQEEAQEVELEEPGKHSINVSPLGILFGAYNLNYEYLHDGTHGFLAEGGVAHSNRDDISATSFAGAGGYRWHWRGKQSSGFLGANIGYQRGWASTTIDGELLDVTVQRMTVVGNVGRRWAWDFGLNITLRVGAGYGAWNVSSSSDDPDVQQAVRDTEDMLQRIPVALDGELSLGWVF
jgi:hypothetical protein